MAQWASGFGKGISGNIGQFRFPIDILNQQDYAMVFHDFIDVGGFDSTVDWTNTDVGIPTAATIAYNADASLGRGGILLINAGSADSTGIQSQRTGFSGEYIQPTTSKAFGFGCRFTTAGTCAVSLSGLMLGLAQTDTTSISTAGANAVTNTIAFYSSTTSAALTLEARRSSGSGTGSLTMGTLAHATYNEVCFWVQPKTISSDSDNGGIFGYARNSTSGLWTLVGGINAAIPNTEMCPTIASVNGIATDSDVHLDYYWVAVER